MVLHRLSANESTRRWLLAILVLALILRAAVTVIAAPWGPDPVWVSDQGFAQMAARMVSEGSFDLKVSGDRYASIRTPGYPAFIAIVYLVAGERPWLVPIAQVALDLISVVFVFLLAVAVTRRDQAALIAAALYAVAVLPILSTQKFYNETLFTTILLGFLLVLLHALRGSALRTFALAGLVLGIATLVRPVAVYLPFAVLPFVLFEVRPLRRATVAGATFLVVFLVTIGTWQAHNYRSYGYYALTSIRGYGLANFYVAAIRARVENTTTRAIVDEYMAQVDDVENPFEQAEQLGQIAVDYILEHPWRYLGYHLQGSGKMFLVTAKADVLDLFRVQRTRENRQPFEETLVQRVQRNLLHASSEYYLTPLLVFKNLFEYALAVVGAACLLRARERRREAVLLLLCIAYFVNVTGVLGSTRYKIPIVPLYLVFAGYGFELMAAKARESILRGSSATARATRTRRSRADNSAASVR